MTNKKEETKEVKLVEVELSTGDVSFEDLAGLDAEAEKMQKENEKSFGSGIPVTFPSGGEYVVRLIPDRDAKGKLRYMKRTFFHTIPGYANGKSKTKDNEERIRVIHNEALDKALKDAESKGMQDTFKFRANEHVYIFVRIFECPKSDYCKPGQDMILILTGQQGLEFSKFYGQLDNSQKMAMLTPGKPHFGIRMKFEDKASKYKKLELVEFAGATEYTIPSVKLPENFKLDPAKGGLLDQVYVNEFDNQMTDETFGKIRNFLNYQLAFANAGLRDPIEQDNVDTRNNRKSSPSQQVPSAAVANSGEKCYIKENGLDNKENGYEGVYFGNPPKDQVSAECMICPNSQECESFNK